MYVRMYINYIPLGSEWSSGPGCHSHRFVIFYIYFQSLFQPVSASLLLRSHFVNYHHCDRFVRMFEYGLVMLPDTYMKILRWPTCINERAVIVLFFIFGNLLRLAEPKVQSLLYKEVFYYSYDWLPPTTTATVTEALGYFVATAPCPSVWAGWLVFSS